MNIVLFEGEPFFPRGDDRYQHIRKVLKKGVGDAFFAGIVDGAEGTATIASMDDAGLSFDFSVESPPRPLPPVTMIIGFPRPIQLKRILRDVASLGASTVMLAGTDLGEKSYRDSTLVDRGAARAALLDGCSQAGSSAVPKLELLDTMDEAIAALSARDADGRASGKAPEAGCPCGTSVPCGAVAPRILLDVVNADRPLVVAPLGKPDAGRPLVLAIGSERGWSERERALFRDAGFMTCSLGSRILRTETACVAALGIALARSGLMEGQA
jgi:16S rRNA (uracil1498-N3)-methyltransferase